MPLGDSALIPAANIAGFANGTDDSCQISRQLAKSDNDDRCGLHHRTRFNTLVLPRFMAAEDFRGRWPSSKHLATKK